MMFVATHKISTSLRDDSKWIGVKYTHVTYTKPFGDTTIRYKYWIDAQNCTYNCDAPKPITLTCPYCQTDIPQQERVECEKCGWIAETISEGIFNALNLTGYYPEHLKTPAFCNKGLGIHIIVHHIKEIHWLEIKAGAK